MDFSRYQCKFYHELVYLAISLRNAMFDFLFFLNKGS